MPTGPLAPVTDFLHIQATKWLYSEPSTLFGMVLFTFPFMVMNVGAALSNVDPMLEEAAGTLGAAPWQVFLRMLFPVELERHSGRLPDVLRLEHRRLCRADPARQIGQQRVLSLTLYTKAMSQSDFGLASAMGVVLMVMAFAVTWLSLKFSRGALGA